MEQFKLLFQVFTNKKLFLEWLLAMNVSIGKKLIRSISSIEADKYAVDNKEIDMRTAPNFVKSNVILDTEVLDMRWKNCLTCEFFIKDTGKCSECGCYMAVKHKLKGAFCPVGKWDKYKGELNGSTVTI